MILHALVLVSLLSLAIVYGGSANWQPQSLVARSDGVTQAAGMAVYRNAVIAYYTQNPTKFGSAAIGTLIGAGVLPSWSPQAPQFAHYRNADGSIVVYASAKTPPAMLGELLKLSRNSLLVGQYSSGDSYFRSAHYGPTTLPLPAPSVVPIPAGSPLWMAQVR